jgi:site-specific DNA recombinase
MLYQFSGRKNTRRGRRRQVRRAIYTRKSTSEGLESDFNTLDAQREAAEFDVRAMRHDGWLETISGR